MARVFLCLVGGELVLLLAAATVGILRLDPGADRHIQLGVLSLLWGCLVQATTFTYFTVTAKMIGQALHLMGANLAPLVEVKRLKRSTTLILAGIVISLLAAAITGATRWRSGLFATAHGFTVTATIAVHAWAAIAQYGLIIRNSRILVHTLNEYTARKQERKVEAGSTHPSEYVVLVDEHDRPIGTEEKLTAHRDGGKLHRAFSVFLLNSEGQMLLQRRSIKKYHFGGLWTNACCGHPREGEVILDAARRRLSEEMGCDADLENVAAFIYKATDARSELTEHEYDHVLLGRIRGQPNANASEVDDWKWVSLNELVHHLKACPNEYTPWFPMALKWILESHPIRESRLRLDGCGTGS